MGQAARARAEARFDAAAAARLLDDLFS
jgi:hypothetical protein